MCIIACVSPTCSTAAHLNSSGQIGSPCRRTGFCYRNAERVDVRSIGMPATVASLSRKAIGPSKPSPKWPVPPNAAVTDWDDWIPPRHVSTAIDTVHLFAHVRIVDKPQLDAFFQERLGRPGLRVFLPLARHWHEVNGLEIGLFVNHPSPNLPRYPNCVVRMGSPVLLRLGTTVAALEEAIRILKNAGVQLLAHQVSAIDLALDFVDVGLDGKHPNTLRNKFLAARSRVRTRATVLPQFEDWGLKVCSRAFAVNAYDLTRRLRDTRCFEQYSEINSDVRDSDPTSTLTRVEFTARRRLLHECTISTLHDLNDQAKRGLLAAALARRFRIADCSYTRKTDPIWSFVVNHLTRWTEASRAIDKSPRFARSWCRRQGPGHP